MKFNPPPRPPSGARAGARPSLRGRDRSVWLFGVHAVLAALANPNRRCRRLVVAEGARRSLEARLAAPSVARPGTPVLEVTSRQALAALLPPGSVHQGIALEADPLPEPGVADICRASLEAQKAVVVVLDQVTDPHNVGAALRSAAALGAAAVIVTERHAPGATGTLAKAASGALEVVPLVRAKNLVRALGALKEAGFWCVGLDAEGDCTLAEAKLGDKVALVLGAEGPGLRRLTRERCDLLARLPMTGAVESLNVASAAAVALYELFRSKEAPGGG